jgi:hypothetical protein
VFVPIILAFSLKGEGTKSLNLTALRLALTLLTMRMFTAVFTLLILPPVYAMESASLNVGAINAQDWKLEGIKIVLADLAQQKQKLILTINRLTLPKPFDDLQLANIRCAVFSWHDNELHCEQGRAEIRSKRWQSPAADFSFHIKENLTEFKMTDMRLLGGTMTIAGDEKSNQWQLEIKAKALDSLLIQKQLQQKTFDIKSGSIDFELQANGSEMRVKAFNLIAGLKGLTGQTKEGKFATEALTLSTRINARNHGGLWQWQSHSRLTEGALYAEPVYLEAGEQPIALDAIGDWDDKSKRTGIRTVHYSHAQVGELSGSGVAFVNDGVILDKAELLLRSDDLEKLSAIYLKPFFEQTDLEGVTLAGRMNADLAIVQQSLTSLKLLFNNLAVKDAEERFGLLGGTGAVNWSREQAFAQPSKISWRQLKLRALPVGPARLDFFAGANEVRLLEKVNLPFLGGTIAVNQFNWQSEAQQEPEIYFEGGLNNVSLEQLSKALNWTPLSGTVSGKIPGVEYRNKTLRLGGELIIRVFDGVVKITDFASSGLSTDFPRLNAEIEIDNLDMDQLTRKFEFGGITGRLSGFVKKLSLENWKPVSFYAWLGTPEDDDSSHKISQKAVKNIANIGGGGASDLLSRSFLSFFETFRYDKLGLGCYLHDGVCQLMGVEAAHQGYAIIKGGGLPRIDVIGYNPEVDWDVLMERLKRITSSDEVIVK